MSMITLLCALPLLALLPFAVAAFRPGRRLAGRRWRRQVAAACARREQEMAPAVAETRARLEASEELHARRGAELRERLGMTDEEAA